MATLPSGFRANPDYKRHQLIWEISSKINNLKEYKLIGCRLIHLLSFANLGSTQLRIYQFGSLFFINNLGFENNSTPAAAGNTHIKTTRSSKAHLIGIDARIPQLL